MNGPSKLGKAAHNLGMSAWFGGTLFGQVALNPTVSTISDKSERGRVLNEAWARFQAVNLPAALSTVLGWRLGGVREDAELRAPGLTRAKDVLLGGAVVNTVASAVLGATVASRPPEGFTPVRPGTKPPPGTRAAAAAAPPAAPAVLGPPVASRSPEGFTPVRSGNKPAPETPSDAASALRLLRFFSNGSVALLAASGVVSGLVGATDPKPHGLLSRSPD